MSSPSFAIESSGGYKIYFHRKDYCNLGILGGAFCFSSPSVLSPKGMDERTETNKGATVLDVDEELAILLEWTASGVRGVRKHHRNQYRRLRKLALQQNLILPGEIQKSARLKDLLKLCRGDTKKLLNFAEAVRGTSNSKPNTPSIPPGSPDRDSPSTYLFEGLLLTVIPGFIGRLIALVFGSEYQGLAWPFAAVCGLIGYGVFVRKNVKNLKSHWTHSRVVFALFFLVSLGWGAMEYPRLRPATKDWKTVVPKEVNPLEIAVGVERPSPPALPVTINLESSGYNEVLESYDVNKPIYLELKNAPPALMARHPRVESTLRIRNSLPEERHFMQWVGETYERCLLEERLCVDKYSAFVDTIPPNSRVITVLNQPFLTFVHWLPGDLNERLEGYEDQGNVRSDSRSLIMEAGRQGSVIRVPTLVPIRRPCSRLVTLTIPKGASKARTILRIGLPDQPYIEIDFGSFSAEVSILGARGGGKSKTISLDKLPDDVNGKCLDLWISDDGNRLYVRLGGRGENLVLTQSYAPDETPKSKERHLTLHVLKGQVLIGRIAEAPFQRFPLVGNPF